MTSLNTRESFQSVGFWFWGISQTVLNSTKNFANHKFRVKKELPFLWVKIDRYDCSVSENYGKILYFCYKIYLEENGLETPFSKNEPEKPLWNSRWRDNLVVDPW